MSYLGWPRLHFAGRFQADTSTVNNDVRHYKSDAFQPQFQAMMVGHGQGESERTNGYWNPEGTGAWRMLGCRVTGVALPHRTLSATGDHAAVGLRIAGSSDRVAGKLVDLDPQQQAVSQIWGLTIALEDEHGNRLLDSAYRVSTFTDLWKRQQISANFDQTLAAAFQSELGDLVWGDISAYPVLQELRAASADGVLSIRFNAFGFDRSPQADDYTTGVVVGTIGPASAGEPAHFVLGRQLVAELDKHNPTVPKNRVYGFQCLEHPEREVLSADLGNCLPIEHAAGDLEDIGPLFLGVARDTEVRQGQTVGAGEVAVLGQVPYLEPGWYPRTAGVVDFHYGQDPWLVEHIADHPLVLLGQESDGYRVLVRETAGGLYARADNYVYRLDPGAQARVDVYATRYGRPTAMTLLFGANNSMIGGAGTGATLNAKTWPVPVVGTPATALHYESSLAVPASGHAQQVLAADPAGPGCPRGYLDGQVYGVGYTIADAPEGYVYNPWNFISVLLWDLWPIPEEPTWYRDIQPILQQYGNLYPIMSRHLVDLGDYDSVVAHLRPLVLSFSLPVSDPNSMPVSRDLSANKRAGILRWLNTPGPDGLPLKGSPEDRPAVASPAAPMAVAPAPAPAEHAPEPGGKLDYLMQVMARRNADTKED